MTTKVFLTETDQRQCETNEPVGFDPDTGEVLVSSEDAPNPFLCDKRAIDEPSMFTLYRLAHAMSNFRRESELMAEATKKRIAEMKEMSEVFAESRDERIKRCSDAAKLIIDILGAKGALPTDPKGRCYVKIDGKGRFRYRSLVDTLDDRMYESLVEEEKAALRAAAPDGCYVTKVMIVPDKKTIREMLQAGQDVPGWKLISRDDVFELVEE